MKILIIAPQPFYTPRGTPFSVYHRARVFSELGHDVDVLTYGQGADVDIPRCRIIRIPAFRWLGPVPIGPSGIKLFLDCVMIFRSIGLLLSRRYDVVDAHEEAVFWSRYLKPIFRFRMIYDMHSSLPEQLDNFRYSQSAILRKLFVTLETSALKAADAIVVVCPALRSLAESIAGSDKVIMIENSQFDQVRLKPGVSASVFDNGDESERVAGADQWLHQHRANGVVVYAGTLEAYQGIELLLEAFAIARAAQPDAGLLVVGGRAQEVEQFRSRARELGLGNSVHFVGQTSQREAQRLVETADASVSPRRSGTNTPLKIYHLLAVEVPVIATRIESHTQVLNDDVAILCDPNPTDLAAGIVKALADREASQAMARRASEWYQQHYSRDVFTAKTRRLLAMVS